MAEQVDQSLSLPVLKQAQQPTVADQVFLVLQQRILSLELPPCTKISEADVASKMGVSRQPVREAFKRLARLGFLRIRPQSGTTVSLISIEAVLRAFFIRKALEIQTCRTACEQISDVGLAALALLIEQQKAAIQNEDKIVFHDLDEQFHKEICRQAGVGYVWELIHENKAHMDRIRMLSLDQSSQRMALEEHIEIFNAMSARDADAVEELIVRHLSRIHVLIEEMKAVNHNWLTESIE